MLEDIKYRATKTLPRYESKPASLPKFIGINTTLITLVNLQHSPMTYETILIVELSQENINVEKIIKLTSILSELFDEHVFFLASQAETNQENIKEYLKEIRKCIASKENVWEKYTQDSCFSYQVEKYVRQLNVMLNDGDRLLPRYHSADS